MSIGLHIGSLCVISLTFLGAALNIFFPNQLIRLNQRGVAFFHLDRIVPSFAFTERYVQFVGVWMLCVGALELWIYLNPG
jgi:hypothetical protein